MMDRLDVLPSIIEELKRLPSIEKQLNEHGERLDILPSIEKQLNEHGQRLDKIKSGSNITSHNESLALEEMMDVVLNKYFNGSGYVKRDFFSILYEDKILKTFRKDVFTHWIQELEVRRIRSKRAENDHWVIIKENRPSPKKFIGTWIPNSPPIKIGIAFVEVTLDEEKAVNKLRQLEKVLVAYEESQKLKVNVLGDIGIKIQDELQAQWVAVAFPPHSNDLLTIKTKYDYLCSQVMGEKSGEDWPSLKRMVKQGAFYVLLVEGKTTMEAKEVQYTDSAPAPIEEKQETKDKLENKVPPLSNEMDKRRSKKGWKMK
eukprot:NODE_3938_length_1257_cov_40.310406_g3455_i0.p1 GENE.NODE_3938_length_1257_cov_40.310406_g3455_i0~~NODE_3938_length_1257_cov_40.310406_g3455_i0.p1  ORF type:complete len:316 (-),score=54.75 NODE_3938_length_1257_cov_40.310406_g3455_i0:69-1016(-)